MRKLQPPQPHGESQKPTRKSTDYTIPLMITSCSNQAELITVTRSQTVVIRGAGGGDSDWERCEGASGCLEDS